MKEYIIINYNNIDNNGLFIVVCNTFNEASKTAFKLLKHQNYHVQLFKVDKEVII